MPESDSDSDVDFDIQVPVDTRPTRKGKSPKVVPHKKARPLHPSNESDSSPERPQRSAKQNPNKRPAEPAWDESSSSDLSIRHDDGDEEGVRRKRSENAPPAGGRPKGKKANMSTETNEGDESEEEQAKAAGNGRSRKRLSIRPNGSSLGNGLNISRAGSAVSVAVSTVQGPPPDAQALKKIYSTCIEMFQSHKITLDNAFQLRFLDLMGEIIEMPDFDKNDMHGAGRALEAGARIYVCRVDKTKHSVMDLASTLNQQKKKKQKDDDQQGDENEVGDQTMGGEGDEDRPKKTKKRRKVKDNRNVAEDESKLSADLEDHSSKAATRREGLKKKLNAMVEDDLDFEFGRYFFSSKDEDPLTRAEELKAYTEPTVVTEAIINHAEIKSLEFIPFALSADFDPAAVNIWGLPIDPTLIHEPNLDLSLPTPSGPEPTPDAGDDLAYIPEDRPADYGPEDLEDHNNGNDTFVNDEGEEVDMEGRPIVDPKRMNNLQEFYDLYLNVKSKYGWCGPTFVRSQFNFLNRNANPGEKKPRKKKDPINVDYKTINWQGNKLNRYETGNPEKSVFDERTIEKWSLGGKNIQPYIGIEGTDEEIDDDFNILLDENRQSSEKFVYDKLFKYFLDPNRNLMENLCKPVRVDEEVEDNQFQREEEDYIADAGFDIERHRDMDDFAVEPEDLDRDHPLNFEDQAPFEVSYAFPASLGGVLMDTEDPISKATDVDSIKFTKKPKPIDMHALKRAILHFLEDKLFLQKDGQPLKDEETTTTLASLVLDVCQSVDKKMAEHLSMAIIVVGLMHVVVDKKLFMVPNKVETSNPLIVCRGKLWKHSENIPLPKDFNIFGNVRDESAS